MDCAIERVLERRGPLRVVGTLDDRFPNRVVPETRPSSLGKNETHMCAGGRYPRIAVSQFGRLPDPKRVGLAAASLAIQAEIARRGPVTCDVPRHRPTDV